MDLTVREAARRAGRSEETIRRWIWAGRLRARKIGNTYRISAADLAAATRGIALPRGSAEQRSAPLTLGRWLDEVRGWRAANDVNKRPGAWRLVIEDRIERSEHAGS